MRTITVLLLIAIAGGAEAKCSKKGESCGGNHPACCQPPVVPEPLKCDNGCRVDTSVPTSTSSSSSTTSNPTSTSVTTTTDPSLVTGDNFGDRLKGLTAHQVALFNNGSAVFRRINTTAEGLGPVYNGQSCIICHKLGGGGGGNTITETRIGTMRGGQFDELANVGGPLIQVNGTNTGCPIAGEKVPPEATIVARRRTTPLFGLGLVNAVADQTLASIPASQPPDVRGRVHWVTDLVTGQVRAGRFGWKSQDATLLSFNVTAYCRENGITTPLCTVEPQPQGKTPPCDASPGIDDPDPIVDNLDGSDPGGDVEVSAVSAVTNFASLLGPPPTLLPVNGAALFAQVGCADCHTPELVTGNSPIAAMRFKKFRPYSDFLLHNMGAFGDGIEQGFADGSEMRTAPLWGIRKIEGHLWHNGSASSIATAIAFHDGQGRRARDHFFNLGNDQQTILVEFVRGL